METSIGKEGLCTLYMHIVQWSACSTATHLFRSGNLEVKGYYCYQRWRSLFTAAFPVQRVLSWHSHRLRGSGQRVKRYCTLKWWAECRC